MGRLSTSPYPSSWAHDHFDPDHQLHHQPCQKLSTSSPPSKVHSLSIGELGINLGLSMELEMDTTTPPSMALEGAAGRPGGLEAAIDGFNSSFVDFLGDDVHVRGANGPVNMKMEEPEEVRAMELLGGELLDPKMEETESEEEDDGLTWVHAGKVEVDEEMDEDETSESEDSGEEAVPPTPFDWSMHYSQQPHGLLHHSPNLQVSILPSPKPLSTALPTPEIYYPPSQLHHNFPSLSCVNSQEPSPTIEGAAPAPLFFPGLCPTSLVPPPRPDSPPFIPPLSHPRGAHLSQRYKNESDHDLEFLSDEEDYSADIVPVQEYPSSSDETSERAGSTSTTSSMGSGVSASQRPLKRSRAKSLKQRLSSVSSESSSVGGGGAVAGSNTTGLRRTEIPAVADDPSIKPYGCFLCWSRAIEEREPMCGFPGKGKGKAKAKVEESEGVEVEWGEEGPPATFRTVRELREHCGAHKRARQAMSETPFRCSLDPCGKLFKSAAGLLWHFTHASSGHFFVSMEEGEDRPTKKFKKVVQASGRTERCPVAGCTKAFKQTAGLAYHLAHAPKHPECVTEAMVSAFTPKLISKTRWWFAKCGLTIRGGGAVGTGGKGGGNAATRGEHKVKSEDASDGDVSADEE